MAGKIFISYRREEGIKDARSLYERLAREFGTDKVFVDLEGIEPGEDFGEVLERQLDGCEALVALVGPQWAAAKNAHGERRLDDESDFVRIELSAALRRRVKVFPVLIDGAKPLRAAELPEPLQPLVRRQAIVLDYAKFDSDIERLVHAIHKAVDGHRDAGREDDSPPGPPLRGPDAPQPVPAQGIPGATHRNLRWIGGLLVALLVVGIVIFVVTRRTGGPGTTTVPSLSDSRPADASSGGVGTGEGSKPSRKPRTATPPFARPLPNFAGRWARTFPADGAEIVVTQDGRTVRFESNKITDYATIDDAGRAVRRVMYAQDTNHGHEVSNVADADLIVTVVSTLEGDVLINDVTSDYKRPYFKEGVHVERHEVRFKRL